MTREEELARQGWEKRTTYDEPRLSEMAEMYAELGLEVRIEPFDPADQPDCAECMRKQPQRARVKPNGPISRLPVSRRCSDRSL